MTAGTGRAPAQGTGPASPAVRRTGQPAGTFRLRVGDHRVVYTVDDAVIEVVVVRVAHRREAYRGT